MKKLVLYLLVMTWLFSLLDWKVIQTTRLNRPEWTDWMHAHERQYAFVTRGLELALCAPCLAFKPILSDALMRVEASREQQAAITHAPRPDWLGFYHLVKRGDSWTFVSWLSWFLYWLPVSVVWWLLWRRILK